MNDYYAIWFLFPGIYYNFTESTKHRTYTLLLKYILPELPFSAHKYYIVSENLFCVTTMRIYVYVVADRTQTTPLH